MKSKRASAAVWILIILILIAAGIGIYFWVSGGEPGEPSTEGSCTSPSDCGSFYDCINSKCVKIIPPKLP